MYKTAKGWLTENEREALFAAAHFGNRILNVGIEYGASVHCFKEGNPDAQIVAIDLIGDEKFDGDRSNVIFIKGDSTKFTSPDKFDVIFVDGGHDYETVAKDIEIFSQLAETLLLFHDYSDLEMHAGVKKALDEWKTPEWKKIDQVDTISVYMKR